MNPGVGSDSTAGTYGVHGIVVEVDDRQDDVAVDSEGLAELLAAVLHHQGVVDPAEVGLAFIAADEMAELNRLHMGDDGPTDVLSFPIDGLVRPPDGQPASIGDVVICPTVTEQARQTLDDELALLVVHGGLHLLGHDHAEPEQAAVMQGLERELLAELYR